MPDGDQPRASAEFKLSITQAMRDQLAAKLNSLDAAPLSQNQLARLETRPGVYELYLNGSDPDEHRVYVGKASVSLPDRLGQHLRKLSGRMNIDINNIRFKCLYVDEDLDAASPEKLLIKMYRENGTAPWNNTGIGGKDPGHNREDTGIKAMHFDACYPVNPGQVVSNLTIGSQPLHRLLEEVKRKLPYLFRYDKRAIRREQPDTLLTVTSDNVAMRDIFRLALAVLPEGWQATAMPGRVILYPEIVEYRSANTFWRKQDGVVLEFAGEGFLEEGDVEEEDEE